MAQSQAGDALSGSHVSALRMGRKKKLDLSGHARLFAQPAYQRLLAAEPFLRKAIPVLIVVFLAIVAGLRFVELYSLRAEREAEARNAIAMTAAVISSRISAAETIATAQGRGVAIENLFADALPDGATEMNRRIVVANSGGTVVTSQPRNAVARGSELADAIGQSQPLLIFGERAGVQKIAISESEDALAVVHHLGGVLGSIAVIQPISAIYADWWGDVTLNVAIFLGTTVILLVILYGYFTQTARASEADRIYLETQQRTDLALLRGRCGLWDWDLPRGRLFWSRSMFEMLGLPARDRLVGFGEVNALLHPEDGDLMNLIETLYESGETSLDRMFRMRHASGGWLWLRVRVELIAKAGGEPHVVGIAVDVNEEIRQAERFKTADLRLRDAIETISEAFVLWDADNRLVVCNTKYQELHGLSDEKAVRGTPYAEVMAAARQPIVRAQVPAGERPEEGARSFEAQLEDGRWLQINERRTKDGGFVSVGTDITQIKRHEERLIESESRQAATIADLRRSRQKLEAQAQGMVELAQKYAEEKDRAEEANRTKSEFLANVSHELRTPLNAIIGFSEIMQSGLFGPLGSPKYSEYCEDIHDSGTYLLGVINDVLDMSRIEAGRMTLSPEEVRLDEIVEEAIRVIGPDAEEQQITMSAETEPPFAVTADRRALKQILINLLSNAVKFTHHGGCIRVRARQVGDSALISIGDTGIGIPREALKKLGRPFEQVQNQFTKSHKGSGLGLAITRSLAELHHGRMRIQSREHHGTVVSLRLPIHPHPAELRKSA
jgi:two-component system cell cycle sensor histidine kinase PleC